MAFRIVLCVAIVLATASARADDLSRLAWLGGCWKSATGEAGSEEQWLPAAGETMLGVGRTVKQGKTVAHEFMEIRSTNGALAFTATPSGQKTATFPMLRISDNEVVFENLQHDFPHRVAYKLEAPGKLAARIEGMRGGNPRVINFPLLRVSCDTRQ